MLGSVSLRVVVYSFKNLADEACMDSFRVFCEFLKWKVGFKMQG